MEIILKKDIERLGKAGSIVVVKDGFARNFLVPNGLAVPLNALNLKALEKEKQSKDLELEKAKKSAQDLKDKLENHSLTIPVLVQEENTIYGSVASQDIAASLKEDGFDIDKNCILLEQPIKSLGIYQVPIKLHPEVPASIKVWIVKK